MDYIAHHGIKGQKWGVRNGTSYPLSPSQHSASEVAAKKSTSVSKVVNKSSKKSLNDTQKTVKQGGGGGSSYSEADADRLEEARKLLELLSKYEEYAELRDKLAELLGSNPSNMEWTLFEHQVRSAAAKLAKPFIEANHRADEVYKGLQHSENPTNYLKHHGIKGQKWGERNGPPYPLKAGAHSAAEQRATKYAGSSSSGTKYGGLRRSKIDDTGDTTYAISSKTDLTDSGFRPKKGDTSIQEDCKKVNARNFYLASDAGYMMNCTNCTMSYTLRRMGLDVQAQPNYNGRTFDEFDSYFKGSTKNTKVVNFKPGKDTGQDAKNAVAKKCLEICGNDRTGVGAIAIKGTNLGHVFNWEKTSSGKIVFLDAQSNQINNKAIDRYFDKVTKGKHFEPQATVLRFDNCEINVPKLKDVAKNH